MQPKGIVFEFPIKSCRKMLFKKFPEFYFSLARVYKSAMCIDFSGLNGKRLFEKYGNLQGYSVKNIFIIKCTNSTELNKTNCYPEDVVNKRLSQVFISLLTIENNVDSNNYENPILEYYNNDLLPISSTMFKNYFKEMNSIRFKSDNGIILNEKMILQVTGRKRFRNQLITEVCIR